MTYRFRLPAPASMIAATCLAATGLAMVPAARAALGGNYQSVQSDSVSIKAQLRSTATTQYTLHVLTTSNDTTVREYVSSAGTVFAVTWHGFGMPDLRQLLGDYFPEYRSAATALARPGARRQLAITQSDLVVRSFGRMRDFRGVAYVPGLVPDGVSIRDLP